MRLLSVQQTPTGFELETPSFRYWLKAGIAFTLGAGIVYVLSSILWAFIEIKMPGLIILHAVTKF